jgi:hypothetical protein
MSERVIEFCFREECPKGRGKFVIDARAPPAQVAVIRAREQGRLKDGRRRLAEAMKRRWAAKRAASAVKKAGRNNRAGKKAA